MVAFNIHVGSFAVDSGVWSYQNKCIAGYTTQSESHGFEQLNARIHKTVCHLTEKHFCNCIIFVLVDCVNSTWIPSMRKCVVDIKTIRNYTAQCIYCGRDDLIESEWKNTQLRNRSLTSIKSPFREWVNIQLNAFNYLGSGNLSWICMGSRFPLEISVKPSVISQARLSYQETLTNSYKVKINSPTNGVTNITGTFAKKIDTNCGSNIVDSWYGDPSFVLVNSVPFWRWACCSCITW